MQSDRPNSHLPPAGTTGRTYYNVPAVKPSQYGAKTALAFFLQGIASSAQMIATLLDMLDRERYRGSIRTGRSIALLASPLGPMLLITALHTPGRWYNMLRIYRPSSPMSIGIWALTAMGALNCLSFGGTLLEERYPQAGKWIDRLFGSAAAAAGGVVSIYMGTELEETSSPVWTGAYPFLSPLFAATAFSNGTAALTLAGSRNGSGAALARLDRLGGLAAGLQVVFTALMFRRLNRSLGTSSSRSKLKWALWPGIIAPVLLRGWHLLAGQRAALTSTGVATLLGGFSLLNALVYTGKHSGQVPQEYLELTAGPPLPPRTEREQTALRATGKPRTRSAGRIIGLAIAVGFAGFWMGRRLLPPSEGRQ